MESLPEGAEVLMDGNRGIYLGQEFLRQFRDNLSDENYIEDEVIQTVLNGPSEIGYAECWEEIVDNAILKIDGKFYSLHEDSDLFIVPLQTV